MTLPKVTVSPSLPAGSFTADVDVAGARVPSTITVDRLGIPSEWPLADTAILDASPNSRATLSVCALLASAIAQPDNVVYPEVKNKARVALNDLLGFIAAGNEDAMANFLRVAFGVLDQLFAYVPPAG